MQNSAQGKCALNAAKMRTLRRYDERLLSWKGVEEGGKGDGGAGKRGLPERLQVNVTCIIYAIDAV